MAIGILAAGLMIVPGRMADAQTAAAGDLVISEFRLRGPTASGPRIVDALRDQLGLQLRSTSGTIDVLVIDRVEQPSQR